ncbi:MAG: hypothetical protein GY855_13870 [candidate division Zixibacteria bacterium]|nr:hypothetical protein [candidate division Zixibacteria bacterium]
MESTSLISICISSFVSVFALLAVLAVTMKLIIILFPAKEDESDSVILAAITSVMSSIYPGTNITKIEELK